MGAKSRKISKFALGIKVALMAFATVVKRSV
jgi:hypothetical protein